MRIQTLQYRRSSGWSAPFAGSDSDQTLVIAFASPEFEGQSEPFDALSNRYPSAHRMGCSTSGEILGDRLDDDTVTVAIAHLDRGRLRSTMAAVSGAKDSRRAGQELGRQLADPELRGVLVLSDGLQVNGSELASGLNEVFDGKVVVTGGLAGDGDRFESTWVWTGDRVGAGWVSAIGLYGDVHIGHGSQGGWDTFGPERIVTRSEGNVLYELDGRPALELYKEYLGARSAELPASALLFPLAIRASEAQDRPLVRTILGVDEKRQSMTFAGDVPKGSLARLMRTNFERLIDGASNAAQMTSSTSNRTLAIAISCVGRRLVLGERTEEEIEAVLEVLPPGTSQVGFYSYGEISPTRQGRCDLHNQTMTLTTLSEPD